MRNGTAVFLFCTAIADVGSLVEPVALLLFKAFADLIALVTGRTLLIADEKLFADVGSFAPKAMNAEVVGVGKTALIPGIGAAVKAHLFGDGGRIFAKELGDVLERETLVKGFLDVYPVIQSKVFLVSRY